MGRECSRDGERGARAPYFAAAAAALLGLGAAAGQASPGQTSPRQTSPDLAAAAPDARAGQDLLLNHAIQGFGMEAAVYDDLWRVWSPADRRIAEAATPAERRRLSAARYGLVHDPDRRRLDGTPSDVPLAFAEVGPRETAWWALTCFACHAGQVEGRYVPGLGNNRFAFETLFRDLLRYKLVHGIELTEQEFGMGFVVLGSTDGTTDAQSFSAVLSSIRDENLDRGVPRGFAGVVHHDLDAPPLWHVRRKSRLYLDGYVGKDSRVMMQFTLGLDHSGEAVRALDGPFADVLAWIEALEPPAWPGEINAQAAARGEQVFGEHCARCHGTYGENPTYPEKRIPTDVVGTDPVRASSMPRWFREWISESWLTRHGEIDVELDPDGYIAPPLDGIWASAPYLHNGSVPTLWHVLHPDERPTLWSHDRNVDYDRDRVGLAVRPSGSRAPSLDPAKQRRWYDTTRAGKSASGHRFADPLSHDERNDLLEFLKTL